MSQIYGDYKFLFGFYIKSNKITNYGWNICYRNFVLTKDKPNLLGQFLSSNWFKILCKKKYDIYFIVLQVKKHMSYKNVEKDINILNNYSYIINNIPEYIKDYSYFKLNHNKIHQMINNPIGEDDLFIYSRVGKKGDIHCDYNILSSNNNTTLRIVIIIKFNINKDISTYISNPSFNMHLNDITN